jgi:hypothetical protein
MLPTWRRSPVIVAPGLADVQRRAMGFVVEVRRVEGDFIGEMNRMRAWLDHHRLQPSSFRLLRSGDARIVRVRFQTADDAEAFASEFAGTLRASSSTDAAVA